MSESGELRVDNGHQWHVWNSLECCRVCGIARRRDDKDTPCKGPTRVGPRGEPALGWNDEDGTAHCGLCRWSTRCSHLEQIEHVLRQHLQSAHAADVLIRQDNDTGRIVPIPF